MRYSDAFIYTLREDPADAELISHKLMTRAGMIMKVASGIYNYLPLGLRVIRKIEDIIREEMTREGVAELLMPGTIPAELWKESGRWDYYGDELLRLKDRKQNEFCLGPTHEEVVVDVARRSVKSYKQLPTSLYQFQSKFRDERRPRFGLMRGREFIMKDAYSFHASEECLNDMYWRMHAAYTRVFNRMGLTFRPVEADSGAIGGDVTHEFHVLADSGEDKIIYCPSCDYAANVEKAKAKRSTEFTAIPSNAPALAEVETVGIMSIEDVSAFLKVESTQCIKMVVMKIDDNKFVGCLIRGDLELNEVKLRNFFRSNTIEAPSDLELKDNGFACGYMGPIKLEGKISLVADYSIMDITNGVIGANRENWHITGCVPARDLADMTYGDFATAGAGDKCPTCGETMADCRGIEVGQVFKLGTKYSAAMSMTYLDQNGKTATPTMGCYGIGVTRTAASAIEQNHDDNGIIWPREIAPFQVHIMALDPKDESVIGLAKEFHDKFESLKLDCLLDDRDERPGVKFKDADLIGCPLQVIIGGKSLKNGEIEVKLRRAGEKRMVAVDGAFDSILEILNSIA